MLSEVLKSFKTIDKRTGSCVLWLFTEVLSQDLKCNIKQAYIFHLILVGIPSSLILTVKGCVRYIFAGLFFIFRREHLRNKEKCFLLHLESSICPWDNQILTFQIFKCHDIHQTPQHETRNTFYWITWEVNIV